MAKPLTAGELFEQNMDWAKRVALNRQRHLPHSVEACEVQQLGLIGLWKACERYSAGKNPCFHAFAAVYVTGEIGMAHRRRAYRDETMWPLPKDIVSTGLDYSSIACIRSKQERGRWRKVPRRPDLEALDKAVFYGATRRRDDINTVV